MLFLLSFCNNYKKSEINSNNFIDTIYYSNSEDNNESKETKKHHSSNTIHSIKTDSFNKKNIKIWYDKISYNEISISKIYLNSHVDSLIKRFGKPDSIKKCFSYFEETYFYLYYYGTSGTRYHKQKVSYIYGPSIFTIENNLITGFDISHNQFIIDKYNMMIGDSCEKLIKIFPLSYENRYPKGDHMQRMKVHIGDGETFFILFGINYGKLVNYYTWTST